MAPLTFFVNQSRRRKKLKKRYYVPIGFAGFQEKKVDSKDL